MKFKITVFAIIAVMLLFTSAYIAATRNKTQTASTIKIGFLGPLSGGPALWGEGARNMAELAIEEINRNGGINGKKIEADYQDGKCDPQTAVSALTNLKFKGFKFILGGHCSPETVSIAPLSADGSFVMLAGITAADNAVAESKFAFRTSPANQALGDRLAKLVTGKFKNIAVITEQAAFSKSFSDDFVLNYKTLGGNIVFAQEYAPNRTDFRSDLLKLKKIRFDALFISPQSPTTGIAILKQMHELGIKTPIFGNSVLINKDVYEKSFKPRTFAGAFSIVPYTNDQAPEIKVLNRKYKAKFGTDIPYSTFYTSSEYDAVNMLVKAIGSCGEATKCVADYLRNIKHQGVSGNYSFKTNGDSTFDTWAIIAIDENGSEILTPI